MANGRYVKGMEKVLKGEIDFLNDTIKIALVKASYTVNLSTHEFYSDISSHVHGTPVALASKSVTGGIFDCGDPTITAPSAGESIEAVVIYKDTGVAGTSPVLFYFDTIAGFPFTTTGADVLFAISNSSTKLFSLAG